ncbi:YHYH protein [Horticoccus sp. 23ND18S-11]|uniref:YHYH protein n=1 Tax=Horticoccus sp. 23ND18S-11 TaxID=3391832 RepID=UPI0039C9A0F9
MNPTRFLPLLVFAAAAPHAPAQSAPTDPRITSWLVQPSRTYARIYESDAAKAAGNAVTTWSRAQGNQAVPTYAGVMQVSYSSTWVYLRSSGLGYHVMGPWYLNTARTQAFPNFPANTNVLYRLPRTPVVPATKVLTGNGSIGYSVDGVSLFDSRDAFSYNNASGMDASPVNGLRGDGVWNRDAYVNEGVTFDAAFAHQAGPNYHYHANAPALRAQLNDHVDYVPATKSYAERTTAPARHSPILGWLADGHPLYGPYGYASPLDATSAVRRMVSGYVKRDGTQGTTALATTGRVTLPAWAALAQNRSATLTPAQTGPAVGAAYPLGTYIEDYDYLGNLGKAQGRDFDLDLYNGRFCVTPEFPQGTYAYFMAIEPNGTPQYPYNIGRWYYGTPAGGAVNAVNETVVEYVRGGQASALTVTATRSGAEVAVTWASVEGGTYAIETSADNTTFVPLASGLTSVGASTTHRTATTAAYYRVTLIALSAFDARGTGGLSGLNGSGSAAYAVGVSGTARLVNIATRAQIGGAAGTPIAGFVISGDTTKSMLVRAIGPGLAPFGVSGTLADPSLSLVGGATTVATNDNWLAADAATFSAVGAFGLTGGSRDAAIVARLASGSYTTPVGAGGGSGVTLLEVYDADGGVSGANLVNASTRAFVGTGESVLIPGFVVSGTGTVKLLIRAVGPTLTNFGVTGVLSDPQITLLSGTSTVAANDNWSSGANAAAIAAAATQSGAFALATGSRDAALLVDLGAGAYTASVSGVGNTTGTALVEIYVVN